VLLPGSSSIRSSAPDVAVYRESYLIRIGSSPPARVWSGHGPLIIPADIVEDAPAEYLGAGELLNVPDFQQLINGTAQRLELVVSGVSSETLRLALEDAPTVKNAPVHLGRIDFGPDWQPVGAVEWEAVFRADKLSVSRDGETRTITLSIGSQDTGRSYSPQAFFTDADQRRRSPTDAIFSHVAGIVTGTTRRFGPRS
jgi:hypothetical protein